MTLEDFTTYEESDPVSGNIAVTSARMTYTGCQRAFSGYLVKDKGIGHFNGDFDHKINIRATDDSGGDWAQFGIWGMSNAKSDWKDDWGVGKHCLHVQLHHRSVAIGWRIGLYENHNDSIYAQNYLISEDTTYYLRIKRDDDYGTYGRITCDIYASAADRDAETNALANLYVDLHAQEDFRYIYAARGETGSGGAWTSGYCENLDLQEAVPPIAPKGNIVPIAMEVLNIG